MKDGNITSYTIRWSGVLLLAGILGTGVAFADAGASSDNSCGGLPGFAALQKALRKATTNETSGLNNQMWATIADRDGGVCPMAFSAYNRALHWPRRRS